MKIYYLFIFLISLLLQSCGSYTINQKSFINQLEKKQDIEEILHWPPIGYTKKGTTYEYSGNRADNIAKYDLETD